MSTKPIIFILCTVFFICCKSTQTEENTTEVKTLIYKESLGALKDTTFFKSAVMLPLETNDSSLIGNTQRIYKAEDNLFILNAYFNKIVIYNKDGKFINSIHNKGNGPKEYIDLGDICVDNRNKELIVLCTRPSKLQFYSYEGKFLREKDLGDNYYAHIGTDGKYIYLHDGSNINQSKEIAIYDRELNHLGDTLEYANTFKNNEIGTVNHFGSGHCMTQDSSIHFTKEFDNIIYEAKNGKVYPKYILDFKEHTLPIDLLDSQMKPFEFLELCSDKKYVISIRNIVESPEYLLFTTNIGIFVCDKEKGEMTRYSFIADSMFGTSTSRIQTIGNSNKVAMVWPVSQLKMMTKNILETKSNKVFIEKLRSLDDEANPILFIFDF